MMALTTVSYEIADNRAMVFWRTGTKRNGVLDIRFGFKAPKWEAGIIGELIAIRHLLADAKVFGVLPVMGKSLELNVSNAAIKLMAQTPETDSFASRFAIMLKGRLAGVNINVTQSMEYMLPLDTPITDPAYQVLDAQAWRYTNYRELVKTRSMGDLWVTPHAVRRYAERVSSATDGIRSPWGSLRRRLERHNLAPIKLDKRVERHKMLKYVGDDAQIWSTDSDPMRYVVAVARDGSKTLVTCFERADRYM